MSTKNPTNKMMITDSPIAIWKSNGKDAWNGDAVHKYSNDGYKLCAFKIGSHTDRLTGWAANFKQNALNLEHRIKESIFFQKHGKYWYCVGSIFEIHEIDLDNQVIYFIVKPINTDSANTKGLRLATNKRDSLPGVGFSKRQGKGNGGLLTGVCNIQKTWQTTLFN